MPSLPRVAQNTAALVRDLCLCGLCFCLATAGVAQAAEPAREDVLKAEDQQRLRLLREFASGPAPVLSAPDRLPRLAVPSGESRCFVIETLLVQGPPGVAFWRLHLELQDEWSGSKGLCLGGRGLNAVLANLTARMYQEGWITSKLEMPAQNLAAGELRLRWLPGVIEAVRIEPTDLGRGSLPLAVGQPLTVASLDQAADLYNRLPSLGARLVVLPGATEGTHSVKVDVLAGRSWRSSLSLDNTAASEYGRLRAAWQLAVDRPAALIGLGSLLDQFLLDLSSNVEHAAPDRTSVAMAAQYSVPIGDHLFDLHGHQGRFGRRVSGTTVDFRNRGTDRSSGARWTWSALRTSRLKWNMWAGLDREDSRRHIDDVELVLQRRLARSVEIGTSLWSRALLAGHAVDWTAEAGRSRTRRTRSLGAFDQGGALAMREQRLSLSAQGSLTAESADAVGAPTWSVLFTALGVRRPLDDSDLPIIGTRYAVRGFDGEAPIQGRQAAVIRSDLKLGLLELWAGKVQAAPYLGLDVGTVRAPAAGAGSPRTLSGVVAGVFARAEQLSAEVAVALPLRAVPGKASAGWVPTVRLTLDL